MMSAYLVRFQYDKNRPEKILLLTEDMHTRWCDCEPQEGYVKFETIWEGDLDFPIETVAAMMDEVDWNEVERLVKGS